MTGTISCLPTNEKQNSLLPKNGVNLYPSQRQVPGDRCQGAMAHRCAGWGRPFVYTFKSSLGGSVSGGSHRIGRIFWWLASSWKSVFHVAILAEALHFDPCRRRKAVLYLFRPRPSIMAAALRASPSRFVFQETHRREHARRNGTEVPLLSLRSY